jgi:transposase
LLGLRLRHMRFPDDPKPKLLIPLERGEPALETIPGIGVLGRLVATAADPTVFRSGPDFAAWIGLLPRQDSAGGKQKLRGRGRRVFPRAADALDVGSISCVALIGRTSLREVLVISCLNRVAISYRD